MSFVGIVANNEDYENIKKELNKNVLNSSINLIQLNKDSIENMKNVKFDTVAICIDIYQNGYEKQLIENIIPDIKYLIINSDINYLKEIRKNKLQIITYGMNQKATVTTSSIKDDEVLICVQRNFRNFYGNIIEIQEFKKKVENVTNEKVYNLFVTFIIEQLYLIK